ncbi:hypothetical protein HPB52_021983 [Rhipicephalus sanguineus]|uniref:Uncharacterized protein n=1 Tax=Rhipicephalus sanguineus TaxID=34632 RepID=A0A9D4PQK1_RHISA|nr:hypothetical protein HPB52_021983 [Rhipicephalus sanguineus]
MGDELPPDFPPGYSLSGPNRSRAYDLLLKEASYLLRRDKATPTSGAPTERQKRTRAIKKSPGKARKHPQPEKTKKVNPRRTPASRASSSCADTPPLQIEAAASPFFPLPAPPTGHLFSGDASGSMPTHGEPATETCSASREAPSQESPPHSSTGILSTSWEESPVSSQESAPLSYPLSRVCWCLVRSSGCAK